jgi:hypothetical protein
MNKDYIKGIRKAKSICLKYYNQCGDSWIKTQLVRELNDLIMEEEKIQAKKYQIIARRINRIETERIPTEIEFKKKDGSIIKVKATKIISKTQSAEKENKEVEDGRDKS